MSTATSKAVQAFTIPIIVTSLERMQSMWTGELPLHADFSYETEVGGQLIDRCRRICWI